MNDWMLHITYNGKRHQLRAEMEYHSQQVMRWRVYGTTSSLLLENNYPVVRNTVGKRGIQWKIKEGTLTENNPATARLLVEIFEQLEAIIKAEFV